MTHLQWLQTTATLNDYFTQVLMRLLAIDEWPYQEPVYDIAPDESGEFSLYDLTTVHSSLTKPSLQEMENEWLALKQELITKEEERLAEVARIEDLENRWNIMSDIMPVFTQVVPSTPNAAAYFRDKIKNEIDHDLAESRLAAIESAYQLYVSQKAIVDQVTDAYNQLNTDVYDEMESVFGTKNADSATAMKKLGT